MNVEGDTETLLLRRRLQRDTCMRRCRYVTYVTAVVLVMLIASACKAGIFRREDGVLRQPDVKLSERGVVIPRPINILSERVSGTVNLTNSSIEVAKNKTMLLYGRSTLIAAQEKI